MQSYQFKGYELRPARPSDLRIAKIWTDADPDHAGRVDPLFWIEQGPTAQSFLLIDSDGPLFFFKGALAGNALEIHIQFPAAESAEMRNAQRRRVSQGLIEGLEWLEGRMRGAVDELIFESTTPALIRFCEKRLGFTQKNGRLRKRLAGGLDCGVLSNQPAAQTGD